MMAAPTESAPLEPPACQKMVTLRDAVGGRQRRTINRVCEMSITEAKRAGLVFDRHTDIEIIYYTQTILSEG